MLKKVLTLLVVGFAVYYLLTEPSETADAVDAAFDALLEAFENVGVFARELFE